MVLFQCMFKFSLTKLSGLSTFIQELYIRPGGGGGGGEGVYVPPTPHSEINVHNVFVRMSNKVLNLV